MGQDPHSIWMISTELYQASEYHDEGDYVVCPISWDHSSMVEHAKSHRWPVVLEINGQSHKFFTVGHVARALRRSVWTVSYWERIKLLPEPAVVWFQGVPFTRRRLYLDRFIDALSEISRKPYMSGHLLREDWRQFQLDVWAAYQEHVVPLNGGVVFDCTDQVRANRSGQGSGRHDLSAY